MNDDPISQLPEPYRAAWEIMQQSIDLETVLKNTLLTAIAIARADSGMIVLKSESELYGSTPAYRTLPDMKRKYIYERSLSLLDYALALKVVNTLKSELIPNTGDISSDNKQVLTSEFLSGRRFRFANEVSDRVEIHQTLLVIPLFADSIVAGAIALSRPIAMEPFSHENLLNVELFVGLISKYVCTVVAFNDSINEKSELIKRAVYEVFNPLSSIRGYSELLSDSEKFGMVTDAQREFARAIQNNVKQIKRLLENFYELARLEVGEIRFENKRFNVSSAILEVYEEFKSELDAKKQTLELDLENHIFAYGDRNRVCQISGEIMRNANLYSPENGVIRIFMSSQDNSVRVSFADNGIGLTEEIKSQLFKKFYRSDRDNARAQYGTGLGLHIAKYLIEKMDGQIGAEDSLNQGSTFWFTLPIVKE